MRHECYYELGIPFLKIVHLSQRFIVVDIDEYPVGLTNTS